MNLNVQKSLDRLSAYSAKSLDEYKDAITRECCTLTSSTLSYFATMNRTEDVLTMIGWSKSAMVNCAMMDKPIVYKLAETGLWGDAVREHKPVITNDYKGLVKPTKKGYPEGHVSVRKHMNLPVFEKGKVVVVIGVGNKVADYTLADAALLEEFMGEAWKVLKTKL
ncbi:MAG: GAF domain-containing protein [Anaerolineaceae bacterium]|nr:GAF domain-containing protein [Anaerolineaceae bacterium]